MGSGWRKVVRVVTSDTRGFTFKSSHRLFYLNACLLVNVCRNDENKEKSCRKSPNLQNVRLYNKFDKIKNLKTVVNLITHFTIVIYHSRVVLTTNLPILRLYSHNLRS